MIDLIKTIQKLFDENKDHPLGTTMRIHKDSHDGWQISFRGMYPMGEGNTLEEALDDGLRHYRDFIPGPSRKRTKGS